MAIRGKIHGCVLAILVQGCVVGWLGSKVWHGFATLRSPDQEEHGAGSSPRPASPKHSPALDDGGSPLPIITLSSLSDPTLAVVQPPEIATPDLDGCPEAQGRNDGPQAPSQPFDTAAFLTDASSEALLAVAIQQGGTPEGREALAELLNRPDLPASLLDALVRLASTETDPAMLVLVARGLGWFDDPAAGRALQRLLARGPTPEVRCQAVISLVERGDAGALDALASAAAEDVGAEVRGEAAAALGLLGEGDGRTQSVLARLAMTEQDPAVLARIRDAARSLAPAAHPIVPVPGLVPSRPVGEPCSVQR